MTEIIKHLFIHLWFYRVLRWVDNLFMVKLIGSSFRDHGVNHLSEILQASINQVLELLCSGEHVNAMQVFISVCYSDSISLSFDSCSSVLM